MASFVSTIKTVVKEFRKSSKLNIGESPFTKSTTSRVRFSFALLANNSRPSSVKVKIKRNSKIEKVAMSAKVRPKVSKRSSKRFQD